MMYREKKKSLLLDPKNRAEWDIIVGANGKKQYRNKLSKKVLNYEPYHARGGILADEMGNKCATFFQLVTKIWCSLFLLRCSFAGLGKTLQVVSLIAATSLRARTSEDSDEDDDDDDAGEEGPPLAAARPTLIVSPLSVLSNWEKQITDHVRLGHLDVILYAASRFPPYAFLLIR